MCCKSNSCSRESKSNCREREREGTREDVFGRERDREREKEKEGQTEKVDVWQSEIGLVG